jgi:hypothetical protein
MYMCLGEYICFGFHAIYVNRMVQGGENMTNVGWNVEGKSGKGEMC